MMLSSETVMCRSCRAVVRRGREAHEGQCEGADPGLTAGLHRPAPACLGAQMAGHGRACRLCHILVSGQHCKQHEKANRLTTPELQRDSQLVMLTLIGDSREGCG